tara:strand:- start:24686 stop:25864 length:1179 start_codon:yes stop_codon:yes gene_type:complete
MIYIFHLIEIKFLRCHLNFNDNEEIMNIYILNKKFSNSCKFIETGYNMIKSKNKYYGDYNELIKLSKKFKPDIVFVSKITKNKNIIINLLNKFKCKIYYLHHGLWDKVTGLNGFKNILNTGWKFQDCYEKMLFTPSELEYFNNFNLSKDKMLIINGSPQLDYAFNQDYNKIREIFSKHISISSGNIMENCCDPIDKNRKFILLVENNSGVYQLYSKDKVNQTQYNEYVMVLKRLIELSEEYDLQILCKMKTAYSDSKKLFSSKEFEKLTSNPRVTLIWRKDFMLYHFMFADVIFSQNCSTVFCESILCNPLTVQINLLFKNDNFCVGDYNLFRLLEIEDIEKYVNNETSKKLITKEYLENKNKFVKSIYGDFDKNTINRIYEEICKSNNTNN